MLTRHFRSRTTVLFLIAAIPLLVFAYPAQSSAPDILVTTTSDLLDFGGAQQVADLPGPDGLVSLREAIIAANNRPGPELIGFNIPTSDAGFGGAVFTIAPLSVLPPLSGGGTTIDGTTQTAFTGNSNPAGPEIVITGSSESTASDGLFISSANNVIRGLVINSFPGTPGGTGNGIVIYGPQSSGNVVSGCFVGIDATGTSIAGNASNGIFIIDGATNNRVGGLTPSERNVVSGNGLDGISMHSGANPGANQNVVQGNFVGTDVTGTIALGNARDGVDTETAFNTIGGPDPAARNICSGNLRIGVFLVGGINIADHNLVQGNYIGMDVTGTVALGNQLEGVGIVSSIGTNVRNNVVIGNLISANALDGVGIFSSDGNLIKDNLIGTDVNGNPSFGNGHFGLHISGGPGDPASNDNRVEDNVIAGNASAGVFIAAGVRNSISRNRIFSNGDLGIQLNPGLTPNDPGDLDTGPNELMNYPVLDRADATPVCLLGQGTIDTPNPGNVVIEFFANPVPTPGGDPSGHGEGAVFLGSTTPNASGNFWTTLPPVSAGTLITATATDAAGNTSEFAANIVAGAPAVNAPVLTALGPARVWIGLKNSDDVGTKFDVLAEVFKNSALIGSGQLNGIPGGSSGFNNAVLRTIDLALSAPVDIHSGDSLSFRLSVRIAVGVSGHRSGTARLWFNDVAANTRFAATIGCVTRDHFLLNGFALGATAGTGPKKTIDVFVDSAIGGNPFKPFGTWSKVF
ncbi:MAG: right-handed parallel beta-helix repeat-containing protein [Acidobacteriota bacterium]